MIIRIKENLLTGGMNCIPVISFLLFIMLGMQGCADDLTTRTFTADKPVSTSKPLLLGLASAEEKPVTMKAGIQVAYNFDTVFFHITWQGNRGDNTQYLAFDKGRWIKQGADRRDAQSTIDRDGLRGQTDAAFTSAESNVSFFLDDPMGDNAVPGFAQFGCFLACHNDNRYMPEWDANTGLQFDDLALTSSSRDVKKQKNATMYLPESNAGINEQKLDLWYLRLGYSAPIGWADDQYVTSEGRVGDKGIEPYELNIELNGSPKFVLNGVETRGVYRFSLDETLVTPYRFFMRPDTENILSTLPVVTSSMEFINAKSRGYQPVNGDMVPAYRLRQPTQSRGDISALDSYFEPSVDNNGLVVSHPYGQKGTVHAYVQRKLNTLQRDDIKLIDGGVYNIAFAINTGFTSGRDHYISLPMSLGLNAPADIVATQITESQFGGVAVRPDFSNEVKFPVAEINMVLPGIASYEFLTGQNINKNYFLRNKAEPVGQVHRGSSGLMGSDKLTCADCHTVTSDEAFNGRAFYSGSLADLVTRRGGVYTPTPIN